jgi:glycosyltransferase involved in cell wall biosynthesis
MKVVLTYRVIQHWRSPVFRRLAGEPGIDFVALHGSDLAGTPVVNGRDLEGFVHRELFTLWPFGWVGRADRLPIPFCPGLMYEIAHQRPDVILAEGGSNLLNNLLVFVYAILTRTPVVWWTLGEIRRDEAPNTGQKIFRAISAAMERRSTALLGYSSLALDHFDRKGYPRAIQFRAVNCIDTDRADETIPAARIRAAELRRELGLEDSLVLLFVGALNPGKRLEDLIDVYARLRKTRADLRLVIVGDGAHRTSLEARVESTGAPDVLFAGQVVEGAAAWFQLGDVFVLPGLGGLAISEAMVHSLPVVCSEADGCELDLIEPGENGYLFEVGNPRALEQSLEHILADRDRLRRMGEHSRWIIDHRYNITTYMSNVVDALRFAKTGHRDTEIPS